jgi:hypothetical protein
MDLEYYDTDDALRNTLTVEVSEQVDVMKIWGWRKRTGLMSRVRI